MVFGDKELDKRLDASYSLGNTSGYNNGLAEGLNAGDKRTCKILWEVFKVFEDDPDLDAYDAVGLLDDLRDKLTKAIPYGPEEGD